MAVAIACLAAGLMLSHSSTSISADEAGPPAAARSTSPPRPLTGKRWIDMNYGPYQTLTLEAPQPRGNIAYKGVMIHFDDRSDAHVVFDADLLRFAAGWTGGNIDWTNVAFDGSHMTHSSIVGRQVFGNGVQPGWAHEGSFRDPRPLPYGPLAKDVARYRGLYLHGNQVILSYTVGKTAILELPGLATNGDAVAFSRTLDVGESETEMVVQVAEQPGLSGSVVSLDGLKPAVADGPAADHLAILGNLTPRQAKRDAQSSEADDDVTAVGIVGDASKLQWSVAADASIRLKIPAAATPTRCKLLIWRGPADRLPAFAGLVKASPPAVDLHSLTRGGPARWPQKLKTRGVRGRDDGPYAADIITAPMENPWNSWMRFGGFDFFADGRRAAICTWNGDVWIVDGIDASLDKLNWQRIATGLFQPLGLKIVQEQIYVCCRDQIVRLHDLNGDGEIDYYETFNNDHQVTDHFHEFAMGLETDAQGNFYYAKAARHALDAVVPQHGTLLKVSPDGAETEIICNGFRAPNGVAIGPRGEMVTSDQEGHWVPANRINWLKPGGFYGNMWSFHRGPKPTAYDLPLVWFSREIDRSPAEQMWVASDRWGPFQGSLISTSYGTGQVFLVMHEQVNGIRQGGLVRFPLNFPTGIMRGRFQRQDGQFYTCGLVGWATDKTLDGGFYRVRYTGRPAHMPREYHVAEDGVAITFTEPLDKAAAEDVGNYDLAQWNYHWTAEYGSKDYRASDGNREGKDPVAVLAAELQADRRSVVLRTEPLRPVMQLRIGYKLRAADGAPIKQDIYGTVHALAPARYTSPVAPPSKDAILTEQEIKSLRPGLVMRVEQDAFGQILRDARAVRLAALYVDERNPVTPFLATGPFRAELTGWLRAPLKGEYAISAEGAGGAEIEINGKSVWHAAAGDLSETAPAGVTLVKGYNKLRIRYASPDHAAATLRVLWSGEGFVAEPLPPDLLFSSGEDPQLRACERLRLGRDLFADRGCAKCHQLPERIALDVSMPEMRKEAPALTAAGTRFQPVWLARWIENPRAFRPAAMMPLVLHSADEQVNRQQAADIVSYLATLGEKPAAPAGLPSQEQIESGEKLFEDLGCMACHHLREPAAKDSFARLSLAEVREKFQPGALEAFLRHPHEHFAWSRMPDFQLSDSEAAALAAYLQSQTPESVKPTAPGESGDPKRGEQLFTQVGCSQCHALGDTHVQPPSRPTLQSTAAAQGCLADDAAVRGAAPDFGFSADERQAMRDFLATDYASLARDTPAEFSRRQFQALRCAACHRRDGAYSQLPRIQQEESTQGHPPELLPNLTWAGQKLRPEWTAKLFSGQLDHRSRTWLKARMPIFPARAEWLAQGLSAEHGYPPDETAEPPRDAKLAEVGRQLIGKEGGFNCVSCHAVGSQAAVAAFDAPGINLSDAATRLRYDYFPRWMADPLRVDPSTKMPKFTADGHSTAVLEVFEGDARRQFDAIWQHMETLRGNGGGRKAEGGEE